MAQKSSWFSIIFSIYTPMIILMISKSTNAQSYDCGSNTRMFANNSQYEANLNTLFRFLLSNATDPNGYHQAVSNNGNPNSEAVYGHFLCRGDLNASACQTCVNNVTATDLPTNCPNRKVAIVWRDECLVRYSNQSFFGKMDTTPWTILLNLANVTGNSTRFEELLSNMMNNVIAYRAPTGGPLKKFATDFVNVTTFQTVYGLGQCTPDLTPTDCNTCLVNGIQQFRMTQGAHIKTPSCVVRYEIYPFFDLSSVAPPPQPLPLPPSQSSGVTKITIMNNCSYTVWPAISTMSGNVNDFTRISLQKGESKIINIESSWRGSIWGRTGCSINPTTNFSCETGDCGTGKIECQGTSSQSPVTLAEFRIDQIENKDIYYISVNYGYNLPMMVAPEVVTTANCGVTGCVFNLNDSICPLNLIVFNRNKSMMIGCRNPCSEPGQCCKISTSSTLCLSSDYVKSSDIFERSCPRASNNPSDSSYTTFTCQSYKTSYKLTFCPSPNMASSFSTPTYQAIPESIPPSSSSPSSLFTPSPSEKKNTSVTKVVVAIVVPIVVLVLLIASCTYHIRQKSKKSLSIDIRNVLEDFTTVESLIFEFSTLQVATNYFSDDLMLGGGGFGNVYKGTLPNGQEIAVKRLSRVSNQGIESFKNEAVLIAKLQHKNLVKLLGFCLTREEKLLVYEYVPNKSLNYFLFDPRKQGELDWPTRYNIITGIARGLLYLHEDSRPRIIHRDLKAANILLEDNMNPKIADFGLARMFKVEQTEDDTSIIAGTYGYMAPEYAMHGQFSIKSDVYSFGVLVLEIVSGKKINSKLHPSGVGDLLTHAWRSLKEEAPLKFMDPTLKDSYLADEVMRSIHLGLLCVQENAHERPNMSTIVFMLNTNSTTNTLPTPQRPRFYYNSSAESSHVTRSNKNSTATSSTSSDSMPYTQNQVTISEMSPR